MAENWAEQWKARSEKTLDLPGGLKVTISRPTAFDLVSCGLDPVVYDITKPERVREKALKKQLDDFQKGDAERLANFMKGILAACLVKPRVWTGPPEDCPPDKVTIRHLGAHAESIFIACWEFFDLESLKGVAAKAATFRGDPTGETGEQSGKTVQSDPQPAAGAKP